MQFLVAGQIRLYQVYLKKRHRETERLPQTASFNFIKREGRKSGG